MKEGPTVTYGEPKQKVSKAFGETKRVYWAVGKALIAFGL